MQSCLEMEYYFHADGWYKELSVVAVIQEMLTVDNVPCPFFVHFVKNVVYQVEVTEFYLQTEEASRLLEGKI